MINVSAEQLESMAERILVAAGALVDEAAIVAHSLVEADLRGHESHGVLRLPSYVEKLERGDVRPGATFVVVKESPTTVVADGSWAFGQVQLHRLLQQSIEKAKAHGMTAATLRHVTHVGRLGEYSEAAARAGLASIIMANAHSSRRVAPPGAKTARIGTNPMAYGVPTSAGAMILDFGTAAAAEGKIRQRKLTGQPCPDGWLVDSEGRPTSDPASLYTNPPGAIRPMGGEQAYKGFGLALMIELFAGALSGGDCIQETPNAPLGNCVFLLLLNPEVFGGAQPFVDQADSLVEYIRQSPRIAGSSEIVLPGDPERRTYETRASTGIPLEDRVWQLLLKLDPQSGNAGSASSLAAGVVG